MGGSTNEMRLLNAVLRVVNVNELQNIPVYTFK